MTRADVLERLQCAASDLSRVADTLLEEHDDWFNEAVALKAKVQILTQWIENTVQPENGDNA